MYKKLVSKVAEELDLPTDLVDNTYKGFWLFIRNKIQELPLKDITEEEFDFCRTNFNIPSLGKLGCTKDRWSTIKNKYNCYKLSKEKCNVKDNKN